jgi:plasmid stabilization system protein ParE
VLRLRITRRAAFEIERAERWWKVNRPAAPLAVREDLKSALSLLLRQPSVGVRVASTRVPGVRRLHLGRVGYFLYYRVTTDEMVVLRFGMQAEAWRHGFDVEPCVRADAYQRDRVCE